LLVKRLLLWGWCVLLLLLLLLLLGLFSVVGSPSFLPSLLSRVHDCNP
jgi:hypothetical protein